MKGARKRQEGVTKKDRVEQRRKVRLGKVLERWIAAWPTFQSVVHVLGVHTSSAKKGGKKEFREIVLLPPNLFLILYLEQFSLHVSSSSWKGWRHLQCPFPYSIFLHFCCPWLNTKYMSSRKGTSMPPFQVSGKANESTRDWDFAEKTNKRCFIF